MSKLLGQEKLLVSSVVANNRMNRERVCTGKNSYEKDLYFKPLEFLAKRLKTTKSVSWLDLCCGEGRALIEAATVFADAGHLEVIGIDLVGMFQTPDLQAANLELCQIAVEDYQPHEQFDLITCVHGLHYIGDKLSVIQKAVSWLKADGVFLANIDFDNVKLANHKSSRKILTFLRQRGSFLDNRKHLLTCEGRKEFELPFEYVGADDAAGANYTGQPAVNSHYRLL